MAKEQSAESNQKRSIKAKQNGLSANNPLKTKNLINYAKVLNLDPQEWHERVLRSRAVKTALQINLLEAAVDAGLEQLLKEAIKERSVEKADLLERICKIVGAVYRDGGPMGMQVNITSNDGQGRPLSIKFTDATEVKHDGAEPSAK